ncbi:DUF5985 family protein [Polaromonas sp. YR568]|uniref:DUF5985 family protein n=1 Tax=Polaromonas sp. YR568 TaxID=1855301 RepID=UPI00398C0654
MAAVIYLLCALTCLACFGLLFRAWRSSRTPLLFWSALCFAGLSVNNFLLVVDRLVLPAVDLSTWRLATGLVALLLLLFGLIWEED